MPATSSATPTAPCWSCATVSSERDRGRSPAISAGAIHGGDRRPGPWCGDRHDAAGDNGALARALEATPRVDGSALCRRGDCLSAPPGYRRMAPADAAAGRRPRHFMPVLLLDPG